jgi:hypothetical protein
MMGIFPFSRTGAAFARHLFHCGDFMKSSILRAGVVALACALGLSACGGGSGDLSLIGPVTGVSQDGLVLQNNGGNDTNVVAPYTSFSFSNRVSTDDQFNITVKDKPKNAEACVVTNGKARANYFTIGQISVACTIKQHALTANIVGLTGSGLVIVNGADRQDVSKEMTSVDMAKVNEGGAYGVTVLTQPAGQTCTVTGGYIDPNKPNDKGNGTGIMGSDEETKVTVTCTPPSSS